MDWIQLSEYWPGAKALLKSSGFGDAVASPSFVHECIDLTPAARQRGDSAEGRLRDVIALCSRVLRGLRLPEGMDETPIAFPLGVFRNTEKPERLWIVMRTRKPCLQLVLASELSAAERDEAVWADLRDLVGHARVEETEPVAESGERTDGRLRTRAGRAG